MSIQHFKDGGFTGKLGAMVGQRWKDKNTIRTYVATHNSKSPAQLADRAIFAKACALAQQAMNINRGDIAWQSPTKQEWSWRLGTAKSRLQRGLPDSEALPLYPDPQPYDPNFSGFLVFYPQDQNLGLLITDYPVFTKPRVVHWELVFMRGTDDEELLAEGDWTVPTGHSFIFALPQAVGEVLFDDTISLSMDTVATSDPTDPMYTGIFTYP